MTTVYKTLAAALLACLAGVFAAAGEADEGSSVSIGVEGGTCTFTVSGAGAVALGGNLCESQSGAELSADLQAEQENLSDDFDDMKFWPVLLVGVSKAF